MSARPHIRPHIPVMLAEVLDAVGPREGETYLDGTFGFGGYSQALLDAADCRVVALDRDPSVKPRAKDLSARYGNRFQLIETAFSRMDQLDIGAVDGDQVFVFKLTGVRPQNHW